MTHDNFWRVMWLVDVGSTLGLLLLCVWVGTTGLTLLVFAITRNPVAILGASTVGALAGAYVWHEAVWEPREAPLLPE